MALKLSTELPNGVTAEYYRISDMQIQKRNIKLSVSLYLSQEAREANKAPVMLHCFQKIIGSLPQGYSFVASGYDVNFYEEAYTYLKTLPMFTGAEDV